MSNLLPQSYPLWLAELDPEDGNVYVGRIVGWGTTTHAPLVAFEQPDGSLRDVSLADPDRQLLIAADRERAALSACRAFASVDDGPEPAADAKWEHAEGQPERLREPLPNLPFGVGAPSQ
jgi:hypothetical protein